VRREFNRVYPEGNLAPHVVGFVLADSTGGAGVEQQFEKILVGTPGREILAVDALDNPVLDSSQSIAARPGANIQLTIDATIQRMLERAMAEAVDRHKPNNVAGIVIRPSTGEIVAMASWPDFDARDLTKLDPAALRNNVLSFVYEPGSTMKPLVAGAAVHEGLATWSEQIFCENGRYTWRNGRNARTLTDHSVKTGGHQMLSLTMIIALSDNIGMAKLGLRLGPDRLYQWINSFGFGSRPGICLPGEDAGIVLPKARWTLRDSCISIPMGHEIAVTPLQMALAHAAIANGGTWLPPRLVKRLWRPEPDSGGDASWSYRGWSSRVACSPPRTRPASRSHDPHHDRGHRQEGRPRRLHLRRQDRHHEKLVNGHYSDQHHIGSFVCWAPAEPGVQPELLCLVAIDDPRENGHYGSETAAPVVQKVLQASLEYLGVPKHLELIKDKDAGEVAVAETPSHRKRP